MSTALALRSPARLAPSPRLYSGIALETPAGGVSAFFALATYDRRHGVAMYALRVINRTQSLLVCRTWVVSQSGDAVLAYPVLFEVEPLSTAETHVPVWPKDFDSFDRAMVEVVGEGVHCIVEAAAPAIPNLRRTYAVSVAAALFIGALALAVAGLLRTAVPQIAAFAVPPEAIAGTTVRAEYAASGAGKLSYAVNSPDGRTLQGGTLADRTGAIRVSIPASNEPGAYTLQLAMAGPLGSANETRVLNAIVPKSRNAEIDDIAVTPAVAQPGHKIFVTYTAAGDGGYLQLLGTDGAVWGQKPFARDGRGEFVVPKVSGARELRVLLHVTKGHSAAQSMAGIVVAQSPAAAPSAATSVAGDDSANDSAVAGTNDDANGTFQVLARNVKSGAPIKVRVLSPRNGMRIALNDTQSHEVTGVDVGADADLIALKAPTVTVATRYTVVANFTDGFGQESIVQPVTILP